MQVRNARPRPPFPHSGPQAARSHQHRGYGVRIRRPIPGKKAAAGGLAERKLELVSIPSDRSAGLPARALSSSGTDAAAGSRTETMRLREQLLVECDAMARYAFASGLQIPPAVADGLDEMEAESAAGAGGSGGPKPTLARIAALHGQLSQMIAPATPRALYLLHVDPARDSWVSMLGPLPTIRRLVVTSGFFTLLFLLTSLSEGIDEQTVALDLYEMHGLQLLLVLLFVLSAAGLGACFHALFTVYRYVSACTYDPRHNASYWIRIGLGLIAGLVLSEVVPVGPENGMEVITKPLLALLGGFSASLVYRILARLVDTVESLFKGDAKDAAALQEQQLRSQTNQEMALSRLSTAGQLVSLRDELAKGAGSDRISVLLTGILDGLVPGLPSAKQATATAVAPAAPAAPAAGGKLDELRGAVGQGVAVARLAAGLLPGDAGRALGALADKVQGGLDVVDALEKAGHVDGAAGQAGALLDKVTANDPVATLLGDAVRTFGMVLAGGPVTPLALVGAVVGLGAKLGAAEYGRWTARVLNAAYTPELFPPGTIDGTSVMAALKAAQVFKAVFQPELDAGNIASLLDMATDALRDDTGEALWGKAGSRFPSRHAFDEGLQEFRKALLDDGIRSDLPADSPEITRAGGVDALLQAIDRIDADPPARADLDRIVLLAGRMRRQGMDAAKLFADAAAGNGVPS